MLRHPAPTRARPRFPCSRKSKLTLGSGKAGREREEEMALPSAALAVERLGQGSDSGRNAGGTTSTGMRCMI